MEQLLIDVTSAAAALGIGRTKVYELLAAGKLRKVKIGRRSLIPVGALQELVDSLDGEDAD